MPPKTRRPLDLTRELARPIVLTGGPRSRLETLQDAAILIRNLEPFRRARPVWDRAAEVILIAAETGKRADVAEATRQMLVALGHENWWKEPSALKTLSTTSEKPQRSGKCHD